LSFFIEGRFIEPGDRNAAVKTKSLAEAEGVRRGGMLRAGVATRRQVGRVILTEVLILATIGTAFGLLSGLYLGMMAVKAFSALGFSIDYVFPAGGVIAATPSLLTRSTHSL